MSWLTKTAEMFDLRKDGKLVFRGSQNDCWIKLRNSVSTSWDHALKYEGWTINPTLEDWRKHYKAYGDGPDVRRDLDVQ